MSHLKVSKKNLVANLATLAKIVDPRLVDAWGIVQFEKSLWVNANGTGLLLNYDLEGNILANSATIPGGNPTGIVTNFTPGFVFTSGLNTGAATFLIATENGYVVAYNNAVNPTDAVIVIDRSGVSADYKGLVIANNQLYVADFFNNRIDVFDSSFNLLTGFYFPDLDYCDPLPANFAPFNIVYIHDRLFVAYAKQLAPDNTDDEPGKGNGYINIFDINGLFVKRFVSKCHLNSPWAMVQAPCDFGHYSKQLMVGNHGDGKINIFDFCGKHLAELRIRDKCHKDLKIFGLWGLVPYHNRVFFASGPDDGANGIVGFFKKC